MVTEDRIVYQLWQADAKGGPALYPAVLIKLAPPLGDGQYHINMIQPYVSKGYESQVLVELANSYVEEERQVLEGPGGDCLPPNHIPNVAAVQDL